jgi:hypothetical protein
MFICVCLYSSQVYLFYIQTTVVSRSLRREDILVENTWQIC